MGVGGIQVPLHSPSTQSTLEARIVVHRPIAELSICRLSSDTREHMQMLSTDNNEGGDWRAEKVGENLPGSDDKWQLHPTRFYSPQISSMHNATVFSYY
jgi:hypothetical protein